MKNRLREIDFVRVIITISVIAIHITGSYFMNSKLNYLWNQSMRYAVPVFILLSGLVLFYSDKSKKDFSIKKFYYSRIYRIIIPYIIWSSIYLIYNNRSNYSAISISDGTFFKVLFNSLLYGSASYHLYFIVIISQLLLIYPLLRYFMIVKPKLTLALSFFCSFLFQTAYYLKFFKIDIWPSLSYPLVFLFPVWIFYFVFGIYFASKVDSFNTSGKFVKLKFGIAWIFTLGLVIGENLFTSLDGSTIKPSVMLFSIISFITFYLIGFWIKDKNPLMDKLVDFISAQSFLIYLSHPVILGVYSRLLVRFNLMFLEQRFFGKWITLIFIVASVCIVSYILSYFRFTSFLGGTYKTRNLLKNK